MLSPLKVGILLEQHLELNIGQGYLRLAIFELAFCDIWTARLAKTRSGISLPTLRNIRQVLEARYDTSCRCPCCSFRGPKYGT